MTTTTTEGTAMITLKFKTGHPGYVAHTETGTYQVFKTYSIYSGIRGGGTYMSWRADFTPLHGETVHVMIGNKYEPEKFNSVKADTKRLAVFACNAHANGAGNEAPKK